MEAGPDTPLFLAKMLEELDGKHSSVSQQDLCRSLCARLDLPQLARLRSALFRTACLDPSFPASLFKDKVKRPADSQQSKKIMVAADIVTIFNLIQMAGAAAGDKLPAGPEEASREACRPDVQDACEALDCGLTEGPAFGRGLPARQLAPCRDVDCADCSPFAPVSEPDFLLGVVRQEASLGRRLQALAPYTVAGPQPCEMQRTYFPMTPDGEPLSDQDSLPRPPDLQGTFVTNDDAAFEVRPCVQKRSIFKEDFHHLMPVSPSLVRPANEAEGERGDPQSRKEPPKAPFFNHSFEAPYGGRYLDPVYPPVPDKRRAKHESLDDLQASTYFGPTPVTGAPAARRCPGGRPGKQTPWPAKSWSLNADEAPDFERSFLHRKPSSEKLRYPHPTGQALDQRPAYRAPTTPQQQPTLPVGYGAAADGLHAQAITSPVDVEEREPARKKFQDKGIGCTSGQLSSDTSSVGTQTEQPGPEPKARRDLQGKYGDRPGARQSDDDSEVVSDDISDIFRFLDDMSASGSTGVIPSSCYNSTGSLSQLPRSDCDSSPEHGVAAAKLASSELPGSQGEKGKRREPGRRSEEELKTSVCRLVLRVGEIERKLESLSGVREEICQVLGQLNKLGQKMQPPEAARVQVDLSSLTSGAASDESASPRGFRARSGSRGPRADGVGGADWCCSDASGSNSESLRVQALKKSLLARPSSRSLTEENSATESKIASISNSPRDWRTITYASSLGPDEEEEEEEQVRGRGPGESKDWRRKPKEVTGTPARCCPGLRAPLHRASSAAGVRWAPQVRTEGRAQAGGRVSWEALVQRPQVWEPRSSQNGGERWGGRAVEAQSPGMSSYSL